MKVVLLYIYICLCKYNNIACINLKILIYHISYIYIFKLINGMLLYLSNRNNKARHSQTNASTAMPLIQKYLPTYPI